MLEIHLLGKFSVSAADHLLTGFEAGKVQEIFAYLLLHRHRPHTREVLIDQIWSDHAKEQAQKGLRQALWKLQSALNGHCATLPDSLLQVDTAWIQINPSVTFQLDIAELEASYTLVQGVTGRLLTPEQAQRLTAAVQLYQGDLLEGCYQNWCLTERERIQQMHLALLNKLMDYNAAQGNYESAITYGDSILRYDQAREQTHCKLMHLYALAGDRTGALRQYAVCVEALATELAVKPAKQTEALYQAIKTDQLETLRQPAPVPSQPSNAPPSLPALLNHLQQMYATLTDLQRNVARDIELIETLLHTNQ